MDEEFKQEFDAARLKHILFKVRLRSFLYGNATDEQALRDASACPLGKWINGVALVQFNHIPETQQLDQVHRQIHQVASRLIDLHHAGQQDEAQRGLAETMPLTDQLLSLLNTLERKLRKEAH